MIKAVIITEIHQRLLPYRYSVTVWYGERRFGQCFAPYGNAALSRQFTNGMSAERYAQDLANDCCIKHIGHSTWRMLPTLADFGHKPAKVTIANPEYVYLMTDWPEFNDGIGV